MNHLKMHSMNKVDENVSKIAQLFPNCVTEAKDENGEITHKIDFDMLKQELSTSIVEGREERYQFTWPDKKQAILTANAPINKTLRPCREESVNFDITENLYIEGDNLEVLKLLQETYLGKIKMIYIDPPYNTGNDFVYEDDFAQNAEDYLANSGQYDEEGNRLVHNTESNGRFHTDWLNMMYPRLKLARDLLTDDGVIFISIDDNEIENLKKVCDEVFGESNFFTQIIIQSNKRGQTYKQISKTHEYLLIYTKSENADFNELEKDGDTNDLNLVDDISRFNIRELRNRNPKFGRFNRPGLFYPIYLNPNEIDKDGFSPVSLTANDMFTVEVYPLNSEGEDSCWRWGKEKFNHNVNQKTLLSNVVAKKKGTGGYNIYEKYRKTTYKAKTIWDEVGVITEKGTVELGELDLSKYFPFPKPLALVKKSLVLGASENDIILDFFSGSATTAHAVMQLNAEDGGKRKFIMVQLPELTDEKSEAYKAGYKNICEIGKERIRRAGQQILKQVQNDENSLFTDEKKKLDIGFRVLKVDSTNMEDVYYSPDDLQKQDLFQDNVKTDRTAEDLLFQVMLDLGVELSSKIITKEINGKTVYYVNGNYLVACFDQELTEETITQIAKEKPYYFVMRDSGFANDSVATNFEQIFTTYSAGTVRKVL